MENLKMNWLLSILKPTPIDMARRELKKSEIHLMMVRNDVELAQAQEALLVKRVIRLERFLDSQVAVHPSLNELRQGFQFGADRAV
jgi:hypothetical protein